MSDQYALAMLVVLGYIAVIVTAILAKLDR